MKKIFLLAMALLSVRAVAQPGKDGALTVTAASQIVNRYSPVTASISAGSSTLSVASGTFVGGCAGDLIMIYQAQGAAISFTNAPGYGDITAYNNAGLYEFKYIQSVSGNIITVQGTFVNSYQMAGRPQVIKVPQYTTLTINAGASIGAKDWKDTLIGGVPYRFGGLTVIHAANIVNNGLISANGSGFRGGQFNSFGYTVGAIDYRSTQGADGGEKGEGIAGYQTDFDNNGGRYGRGAPANGGGGATATNASGGGGANGFNGNVWSGQGVMIVNASNLLTAWALDPGYIANGNALTNSSGGGRGGYSWGSSGQNPTINGPGSAIWGGDSRREVGGMGGRPLTNVNAEDRIYFGGGGGAGQINNSAGTGGGNGGGIVYLITPNGITGTGNIESNGNTVGSTIGCNCDGSGGGGAGGSIIIKTSAIAATQIVAANGGKGGDQVTPPFGESEGGGGGGGGGLVAISAGGITPQLNGGLNGTSQALFLTSMTSNGATQGATGQTVSVTPNFISYSPVSNPYIITNNGPLCAGANLQLTTNAPGPGYNWTGPNSFTSAVQNPSLANVSTTASGVYYLNLGNGSCSILSTTVTVNPQPTVSILNITGSNSITCITPTVDLTVSTTYTAPLNYFWASNSFTSTADTITVVNASTLITVSVVDPATNCTGSATTAIQVNTIAPTSSVAPVTQSVGCGAGVVATATGVAISPTTNVTHNWYSPGLQVPQSSGGPISIYQPPISGPVTTSTFELCNNINGCCTSKTIEVISTGGSYPTFSLTSSQTFSIGCATRSLTNINIVNPQSGTGGVVSFTMLPPGYSGGLSYTTGPQATYTVNTPGTYTMIVKDNANNCETRFPVSIIQNTFAPNISSSAITRTLSCATPSVVLNGISVNSPTTTIDYSWSFQNGPNPNVINNYSFVVNTQAPFTNSVINTYTLTITDQNNACKNTTVVPMWQNTRPPNPVITPSLSALTCATGSVNLSNFSTTGILPNTFPIAFALVGELWEGPTPQLPKTISSSYLAYVPGTYSMTVKDLNNGCTAKTTATVVDERDYPVLNTNTLIVLDCGASTSGVKLPVTVVGQAAAAVSATWYPLASTSPSVSGLNTLTLTTNGPGVYYLVVKSNTNSCVSSISVRVENGALTADFTPDQNTGFAPMTVNYTNISASSNTATGTQSITSVWSFGNGTTKTTTTNISTQAIYTAPGTYSVTLFASKGSCLDTVVKTIFVDIPSKLEVPNVFTPNGDGANDLFFVKSANLTNITAQIFDRWGNKIYELSTDKGNIAWDGKNQQGADAADGVYYYTIKATGKDGQGYDTKGTVSLFR